MSVIANPALAAFLTRVGGELMFAQVMVRRQSIGFELRHIDDRDCDAALLEPTRLDQIRRLAQFTATGTFRPLKSAPDLRRGWRLNVQSDVALETALNQLYPGAIADWFAAQAVAPPVTHYRTFSDRQTGMYRITQKLTDAQVAGVIGAACHKGLCLKRRLWTIPGLVSDSASEKSMIPCLEPCAILLEFARKAGRAEKPGH
jgi:hypothetical protein